MKSFLVLIIVACSFVSFAQRGQEVTNYDRIAIKLLYKKILKDTTLGGDCQCSRALHPKYPIVFKDSIYPNSLEETDALLWRTIYPKLVNDDWLLCWILEENESCGIQTIGTRKLHMKIPSKKRWKGNGSYYQVKMYSPFQLENYIYIRFAIREIRKDKRTCTPIFLMALLDEKGRMVSARSATICDGCF